MKPNQDSYLRLWVPALLLCLCAFSCCPSGIWLDNFGNRYQILTVPTGSPDTARITGGSVDTQGWGCGIWEIRPLTPQEPYDPAYSIAFVAENPYPSPYDNCCYAFRFDGNETSPGCVALMGRFEARDGKCNQSGSMLIEAYR